MTDPTQAPSKELDEFVCMHGHSVTPAAQLQIRKLQLKAGCSLANNLCPDHRDKQTGRPCLACEIERLQRENKQLHDELDKHAYEIETLQRAAHEGLPNKVLRDGLGNVVDRPARIALEALCGAPIWDEHCCKRPAGHAGVCNADEPV